MILGRSLPQSRRDVGLILLREHEPDAIGRSRMIVSLSSSVIVPEVALSIKCLDVVCLLACLFEHIGQPALLSLAADHSTDKA